MRSQHSLTEQFLALLVVVVSDLIDFCDIVEGLLRHWHDRVFLHGRDLSKLRQVVTKLHADINELVKVMEQWNNRDGDSGH